MEKNNLLINKRIGLFVLIETILVILITLPLFILKAEQNSNLVVITSMLFMWLPVIATLITKK